MNAKAVLRAVQNLQRRGADRVFDELERIEPDLVEFVLESSSTIHHELSLACSSNREVKRIHRRAEELVLVAILSLRHAHNELWQDLIQQSPLAHLDSPPEVHAHAEDINEGDTGARASTPAPADDENNSASPKPPTQSDLPHPMRDR